MARNQKLSYKMNMNMLHFLTKQNYSKCSQISMSMSFSLSEASTMFRSSTASWTSESLIFSKGLSLFLSSRTDNCDFSCWRPAWQGSFGLKQWILSSSDPSFARFSAHDLNDSTITSFERAAHDSNIHWTIGEKKFMITKEKLGKMTTFWGNNLPSWAQILSEDLRWL